MYTNPSDHYLLIMKESGDHLAELWENSAEARANLRECWQSSPFTPGMPSVFEILVCRIRDIGCHLGALEMTVITMQSSHKFSRRYRLFQEGQRTGVLY